MNKFILTTLMIFATAGCFAKIPNMKDFPNEKIITHKDNVTYTHKGDDLICLYKSGTLDLSYFSNFDPVTKCTFYVAGTMVGDENDPVCIIEDLKGNLHNSESYYIVEKSDHTLYYFMFSDSKTTHRLVMVRNECGNYASFQSFK